MFTREELEKLKIYKKENRVSDNNSPDFAWYSSIETMGAVDGPGLRLVIFLQGCPLNCLFCHNPETIPFRTKEKKITIDEIIKLYRRNESFYKESGGITFSGGEAMAQIEFVTAAFKELQKQGIHTTLDTAGTPMGIYPIEKVIEMLKYTDLLLVDIKNSDDELSEILTGQGTQHQKDLIRLLEEMKIPYWIRHVYLPSFSDRSDDNMINLGKMIGNLKMMERFEILPYHDLAKVKYENLGWSYPLKEIEPPTKDEIAKGMKLLNKGIKIVKEDPSQGLIIQE